MPELFQKSRDKWPCLMWVAQSEHHSIHPVVNGSSWRNWQKVQKTGPFVDGVKTGIKFKTGVIYSKAEDVSFHTKGPNLSVTSKQKRALH